MKRFLSALMAFFMICTLFGCSDYEINLTTDILTDLLSEISESDSDSRNTTDIQTSTSLPKTGSSVSNTSIDPKPVQTAVATTTSHKTNTSAELENTFQTEEPTTQIDENKSYYSAEDVSLYLYIFGHLPYNFITKEDARDLGWEGGSVEEYAPGFAIGGDIFGNRERLLPHKNGRTYYECDIDTNGKSSRGAKRIVYSDDGLIYFTPDHYETFTLLYGEEK